MASYPDPIVIVCVCVLLDDFVAPIRGSCAGAQVCTKFHLLTPKPTKMMKKIEKS